MTQSLKNTWITVFSIFAMLMSGYVSSAPTMAMNSMFLSAPEVSTSNHNHSSSHHDEFSELTASPHSNHKQTNCHSVNEFSHSDSQSQAVMNHCDDSSSSVDTCCISVCSSVSYPSGVAYSPAILSSTLALHHSIKIGVKVSRIQSLLRPPSA